VPLDGLPRSCPKFRRRFIDIWHRDNNYDNIAASLNLSVMLNNNIRRETIPIHVVNFVFVFVWLASTPYVVGGKPGFVQHISISTARRMMVFGFLGTFALDLFGMVAAWRHREVRTLFFMWFVIQLFFFAWLLMTFSGFDSANWLREAFQWK
jgi:hypothetical protein